MSSFSVFDSKGGEFGGPKASINIRCNGPKREDSGLWIAYVVGRICRKLGVNP